MFPRRGLSLVSQVRGSLRLRGDGPPGGWWGPGTKDATGYLFGEVPPAPGARRELEDWELPYYATLVASTVILAVGLTFKPDTSITTWAREEALKRMSDE